VRQKGHIPETSRVENDEAAKSKRKIGGRPFDPYAVYDYLTGAHDLGATVQTVCHILDEQKVDRVYFCEWLKERFDELIATLNAPEAENGQTTTSGE
jgi:hypothetical protein